ncbi:hypothetical protein BD847_2311 [Flavobacterium cutihirudinis]|uniref:Uncharacterized protein n=1 Tax=Flavobacterium cutihirudinis TaxID=1265740 RepID=A0A3D9FRN1_9FLAO|nr:hypothetical protein [Flavobacterium cutihirudinis]RED23263.1 hypothetical protein BD847_2311 [Flavobacterium cutihirudinis]
MALPDELYNVKFAEHFESIKKMYLQDDRFKVICDNYCESIANAQIYKRKFESNFQKNQDFENLAVELEEEIRFYIIRKGL